MRWLAALFLLASSCASAPPALWNGLQPGPHRVGLQTQSDFTMWYPARSGGAAVTFADLAGTADYPLPQLLPQPLFARARAAVLAGRFPLLLVAQGNGQWALHQAVLSEYLASHGFVVVTAPLKARSEDFATLIAAQTDDLQRMHAFAVAQPNVDSSRVFVLGHSLGARAALLFATRQPVAAIVSLDGGIGTETGGLAQPAITSPLPPILHIYEERDRERLGTDLTYLRSLPTRRLELEKLENAGHIHFTTLGFAAGADPTVAAATGAGPGVGKDVRRMARTVLAFVRGAVAQ